MRGSGVGHRGWLAGALLLCTILCAASPARADLEHSLCIAPFSSCTGPGEFLRFQVVVGAGPTPIVGTQFSIQYDPQALFLVDVSPGNTCDEASPFTLELFEVTDESSGTILYAAGVHPQGQPAATTDAAVAACVSFLPRGGADASICLFESAHPFHNRLVDSGGRPCEIDNSAACPSPGLGPTESCHEYVADDQCLCTPGSDECAVLDTPCRIGVCNAKTSRCELQFINEDGGCDDGVECTTADRCTSGVCHGEGCEFASLCILTDEECLVGGAMRVRLSEGATPVLGAQFSIRYDPAAYDFFYLAPGQFCDPSSPFAQEVYRTVDDGSGEIFYAVGVPFNHPGTVGPATLACLWFHSIAPTEDEVCLYDGLNPFSTVMVSTEGQPVPFFNGDTCPTTFPFPFISCGKPCVPPPIPTASEWGLAVLTLALLILAKICFGSLAPRECAVA